MNSHGSQQYFLAMLPREKTTKGNGYTRDYIKLTSFCTTKKTTNKTKKQLLNEKVFVNAISNEVNIQNLERTPTAQHQTTIPSKKIPCLGVYTTWTHCDSGWMSKSRCSLEHTHKNTHSAELHTGNHLCPARAGREPHTAVR